MASTRAKKVAEDFLETLGKGKRASVIQIAPKYGYTAATAGSGAIQKSKSFKSVIDPFMKKLEKERERVITAMAGKDLDKVHYDKLADVLDTLTKNMQLLGGKSTENIAMNIQISEVIAKKNKIQ